MAGFIEAVGNMFQNGANAVRQAALTPEQIENRNKGKQLLEMVKLASIVSVIGALFFVGIFPMIFTVVLASVIAFCAHELFQAAENVLEILNKATVEFDARSSQENLFKQVSKNTIVLGPLLRAVNPPCDKILFAPN